MKIAEKIAELNDGQMQIFTEKCPASIEYKHNLIGEKKMKKFCELGCSVICTNEYLEMEV